MRLLAHEHRERQLALAAPVQLEVLGAPDGGFAVGVFLDQVQHQVRGRERAAAGVDAIVGHDHAVADPAHVGKHAGVQVLRDPVHHRLLAVEQAAGRQQRGAHAQAGGLAAGAVVARQPFDQLAVRQHRVRHRTQQRRRDADVDVRRLVQHHVGLHGDAAVVQADLARQGQRAYLEPGLAPVRGQVFVGDQEAVPGGFQGRDVGPAGQQESDVLHPAKHTPGGCRNPPSRMSQLPI